MKLIIFTDGGARGNPGPAGIGGVIYDEKGNILKDFSKYVGETTNNQAEYKALVKALEEAKKLGGDDLTCYMDSELIVKQLKGEYKIKNQGLQPLFVQVYNLTHNFKKIDFIHVKRAQNKAADKLANEAMDNPT